MIIKKNSIFKFNNVSLKFFENNNKIYLFSSKNNKINIFIISSAILKINKDNLQIFSNTSVSNTAVFLQNIFKGLACLYKKILEIRGIGYKFEIINKEVLVIDLGLSHSIFFKKPNTLSFLLKKNKLKISGYEINQVSQVAERIHQFKKIDKYKGKGVRYLGQLISLKQGKKKKK